MKTNILKIDQNQCPLMLLQSLNQWGSKQDPQYRFTLEEVDYSSVESSHLVATHPDFALEFLIKRQDFPLSLELFVKLIKSSLQTNSAEHFINILPTSQREVLYCFEVTIPKQRFSIYLTARSFWTISRKNALSVRTGKQIRLRFPLKLILNKDDTQTCTLQISFPNYVTISKQNYYIEPGALAGDLKLMKSDSITLTLTLGEIEISLEDFLGLKIGSELTLDLPNELISSDLIAFDNKLARGRLRLENQKIKFLVTKISQ